MSVEDTSRLVGYNSAYTFRRAFKRVMGVLPTEYRG
ncbi:helix-turn-helix domain-containing protein [Ruminiclostridium cellobioparum]|nr:helix-turn-helix domain-containing protein [Ruminiclostridium cellobioparum]